MRIIIEIGAGQCYISESKRQDGWGNAAGHTWEWSWYWA